MPAQRTTRHPGGPERPSVRKKRKRPSPAAGSEAASLASAIFHKEIAARAYELFMARGSQHGDDWADWFRAEAEVLGKVNQGGSRTGR